MNPCIVDFYEKILLLDISDPSNQPMLYDILVGRVCIRGRTGQAVSGVTYSVV